MSAPHPQPADIQDVLASFDNIPLFMKDLPDEEPGSNTALEALQSLVHDGTPDEVALNFKEQGNDYFKGKRYREAAGFYTQGIDAHPTDTVLLEALLCNRAACNLELKNFGSVLRDCSRALGLNSKSSKAYYRSALALIALERYEEAINCCDICLGYDKDNVGMKSTRDRALKLKFDKEKKEQARLERERREQEAKQRMNMAFKERNLVSVSNPDGSPNSLNPKFDPEDPSQSTLIFPVFFLYPQYATSDVIQEFAEDTAFSAHLEVMFPPKAPRPEWDQKGEYTVGKLVVYAMTRGKRLLKVGKKMTLRDVFSASKDGLEVKDGCLTFAVLPKGEEEVKWIEQYKSQN